MSRQRKKPPMADSRSLHVVPPPTRTPVVESAVLGTIIFIVTEAMLFAGLISALAIVKTSSLGPWPPPDQPRLPIGETAFNTAALLASAAVLYWAQRAYRRQPLTAARPLGLAVGLGAFFVVFQGFEWVAMIGQGLTLTSSTLGSFFYLIVGIHALHAVGGIAMLCVVWMRLVRVQLSAGTFQAAALFWYFVVALWPILYLQVYF